MRKSIAIIEVFLLHNMVSSGMNTAMKSFTKRCPYQRAADSHSLMNAGSIGERRVYLNQVKSY